MADPVQNVYTTIAKVAKGTTAASLPAQMTGLQALRVAQLEPPYMELARSTRLFCGTIAPVANGIAPVVDVPTTTAPMLLYNNAPSSGRSLCVLHVGVTLASGTTLACGITLFGGVTAAVVASPPTANGTGCTIQATRGTGVSIALLKQAVTVPTGTTYWIIDGIIIPVTTAVVGPGKGFPVAGQFIVPPGFGFAFGGMGAIGAGSPVYLFSCIWAEMEMDLDT